MIFALRRLAIALLLLTLVLPARAETIPGADDTQLRAAVERWMAGDDLPAVTDIAELARAGNVAARVFLGRMSWRGLDRQIADLPSKEQRTLFRDMSGGGFGTPWLRAEAERGTEIAVALRGIYQMVEVPPDTWRHYAETLLDAGEREAVVSVPLLYTHEADHVLRFLADIVRPDDAAQAGLWSAKWYHAELVENASLVKREKLAADLLELWGGSLWTDADERAFRAAVAEQRLVAMTLLYLRRSTRNGDSPQGPEADALARYSPVLGRRSFSDSEPEMRPTRQDMADAGAWLLAEAERLPALIPLASLCRARCPDSAATCAHAAFVLALRWSGNDSPLEALVPQDAWLRSEKAQLAHLRRSAELTSLRKLGIDTEPLDQCYVRELRMVQEAR